MPPRCHEFRAQWGQVAPIPRHRVHAQPPPPEGVSTLLFPGFALHPPLLLPSPSPSRSCRQSLRCSSSVRTPPLLSHCLGAVARHIIKRPAEQPRPALGPPRLAPRIAHHTFIRDTVHTPAGKLLLLLPLFSSLLPSPYESRPVQLSHRIDRRHHHHHHADRRRRRPRTPRTRREHRSRPARRGPLRVRVAAVRAHTRAQGRRGPAPSARPGPGQRSRGDSESKGAHVHASRPRAPVRPESR
ncbi:hypothetical protein L226DRAFT_368697 [Lentinus tigrinus ALCF2SS1-7]|uniref:uncharacterized protein n=1 Tax=Lentinus tigrinus ALCF2SS1-7 TaxID=1328758 RepID=UPI001166317C|nr:hypothetical protein L226DRAFT_368697 [Lentinus tigrinus ALCF2SS1-7]